MRLKTLCAASCFHCPFIHEEHFQWLLRELHDLPRRPDDFVVLGDLFEAGAASTHPNEYDHILEDEYRQGASVLNQIKRAVGVRCKRHWTHGNHDDNLLAADPRRIPKPLRSLCNFNTHAEFGPTFLEWNQVPYTKHPYGLLELGPVLLAHGWECGVNSDEMEALQIANLAGGHAHRLIVRGHTHRPVPATQCLRTRRIPLPWHYMNAGTIGPLNPTWANRDDTSLWAPGLIYIEYDADWKPGDGPSYDSTLFQPGNLR